MESTSRQRRQRRATGLISLVFLLTVLLWPCSGEEAPGGGAGPAAVNTQVNRGLRILYAGRPGSDREEDFVGFLRKYFDVVRTGNLQTFQESDTQGFDVTLLDWDTNALDGPRPSVSVDFARPVVTLGVPGGLIGRQWRLKTGYL
jgi:hypothetical protein